MLKNYLITILVVSILTGITYSYDSAISVGRWKKKDPPRIPEYVLLTLTALGGSFGAWIALKVERHKAGDKNPHFRFVVYTSMIMNLIAFVALLVAEQIGG